MKLTRILISFFLFVAMVSLALPVFAHPGNTDKKGGHTCRTNCEKYGLKNGQYHLHSQVKKSETTNLKKIGSKNTIKTTSK